MGDNDDDNASRDLSVSPINSEQSESFEKAATLEGLDPEAISAEEDFTSLSESEDGEIKNDEKRKQLRLRKKELQKKVKELERQVIEISPESAPIDLNGLLEEGEINEDERKRRLKQEKQKQRKKIQKKLKGKKKVNNSAKGNDKKEKKDDETAATGRNYRKKNNEKTNKKPELQRYDVRRILDAKKDSKDSKDSKKASKSDKKADLDKSKDEFGRDLSKKEKREERR